MGRGDQRTRRGKVVRGTYGVTRPRKKKKRAETKPSEATEKKKEKQE